MYKGGQLGNALQAMSVGGHDTIIRRVQKKGADLNARGGCLKARCRRCKGHDRTVRVLSEMRMHA